MLITSRRQISLAMRYCLLFIAIQSISVHLAAQTKPQAIQIQLQIIAKHQETQGKVSALADRRLSSEQTSEELVQISGSHNTAVKDLWARMKALDSSQKRYLDTDESRDLRDKINTEALKTSRMLSPQAHATPVPYTQESFLADLDGSFAEIQKANRPMALELLTRAYKYKPRDQFVLINLAGLYVLERDFVQAKQLLEKAIVSLSPSTPPSFTTYRLNEVITVCVSRDMIQYVFVQRADRKSLPWERSFSPNEIAFFSNTCAAIRSSTRPLSEQQSIDRIYGIVQGNHQRLAARGR